MCITRTGPTSRGSGLPFDGIVQLELDYAEAYNNLGAADHAQGKLDEAVANYQQALRLNLEHVDAHFNLALVLLTVGDFEKGWQEL